MRKMRFRVTTPQRSEAIQQKLGELGYRWVNNTIPAFVNAKFLYANESGSICMGDDENYFLNEKSHEEVMVTFETKMTASWSDEPLVWVNNVHMTRTEALEYINNL